MEYDLDKEERQFLIDAIESYLDAFPEYSERMGSLADLLEHCGKVGTTLHLN